MSAVDVASQPFAPTAEDQLLDLNERADEAARIAFQLESLATGLRDHLAELISDGAKIPPDVEEVVDRLYQTAGEACRDVEDWAADPREDDARGSVRGAESGRGVRARDHLPLSGERYAVTAHVQHSNPAKGACS